MFFLFTKRVTLADGGKEEIARTGPASTMSITP